MDCPPALAWTADGSCLLTITHSNPTCYSSDADLLPTSPFKCPTAAPVIDDTFAMACSDGKVYLVSQNQIEKCFDAHPQAAILAVKWNYEGSALLTAGEDGQIKIWSKTGMLRSALCQVANPVYTACWAPENDQVLFSNGSNIIIKPIHPTQKSTQWRAHDGVILKVDWNLANNLIVSGAEDCKYKVWDAFGRQLYSSAAHSQPITCIAWNSTGDLFAVGSYNSIRICDKAGWSHMLSEPKSGSIYNIAWTPDGTQLASAGGNGSISFSSLETRRLEWKNYEITIKNNRHVVINDVNTSATESLEFRDRIAKASIAFNYFIVCTSLQCYIYSHKNWNTPAIIDLPPNGRVICIKQCAEYFLVVDILAGIQIYTYEARVVCNIKYLGMRPEYLTPQSISLSLDTIAIKDRTNEKVVYLFDVTTGKPLASIEGGCIKHSIEIHEIALNQSPVLGQAGRHLAIIDKNRDLWITGLLKIQFKKLGVMIDTFSWNDEIDMIAAMADGKFVVWYYPNAIFIDEDIAPLTRFERDASVFGRDAQFVSFLGTQCTLRKSDGALVTVSHISPFPALLHEQTRRKQWEDSIRLCRYVKMTELWACLAAMSIAGQDLNTAEVAYAMIQEPAKVSYICHIRDIPNKDMRNAELALFRRQPQEAENILLSAHQVYAAIRMWTSLYQWDKSLDIALRFKSHVDTVLYQRSSYLVRNQTRESRPKFLQYAGCVEVDEAIVLGKIAAEESRLVGSV